MPKRVSFQAEGLRKAVCADIAARKPLWFHSHAVYDAGEYVDTPPSDDGTPAGRIYAYRLVVTGVLVDSSRVAVTLRDIPVLYGLIPPEGTNHADFLNQTVGMFSSGRTRETMITYIGREWVNIVPIVGHQTTTVRALMYQFDTLQSRDRAIRRIAEHNRAREESGLPRIQTYEDDAGNTYANVVFRKYALKAAGWNSISNYIAQPASGNMQYRFSLSIRDICAVDDAVVNSRANERTELGDAVAKARVMEAMWDIETHRRVVSGVPPVPTDTDYTIFALCTAYSWHSDMRPLLLVGACCVPCRLRPEYGVIVFICPNEKSALAMWYGVHAFMNPDIFGGFNSGNFDWPITREKMRRYGQLTALQAALTCDLRKGGTEDEVLKWRFRKESVKIDAENQHDLACVGQFPGVIDVDVLPTMLRLFPRSEVPKLASLNFFLTKMKLDAKEDMPYKRMFRIYERAERMAGSSCHCNIDADCYDCNTHVRELDYIPDADADMHSDDPYTDDLYPEIDEAKCCWCTKRERNLDDMGDVVYYCAIDCVRPHELFVKRLIVLDKRELSNLAFVPLYASYYRADGMKVRNLMGHYAQKFNLAFSNAHRDVDPAKKDHYPGAWVCVPERCLNWDDPVAGMDYSSLYPSLMMTYNLSIDMVVYTEKRAAELRALGYELHQVGPFQYERGAEKGKACNEIRTGLGWMVRHNGILEPTDTKTITSYRRKATFVGGPPVYDDKCEAPAPGDHCPVTKPPGVTSAKGASYSYEPVYGRDKLPGERMGLFPYILRRLFDLRKPVKALWLHYGDLIDKMNKTGTNSIYCKIAKCELPRDDIEYNLNYVDAKQKAIKVLANTFYGESGNFRSPCFELLVAAGTTTAGRENINRVRVMVQQLGCHVHYGDTDSLYLSPPRSLFRNMRDAYELEMARIMRTYADCPLDRRVKIQRIKQREGTDMSTAEGVFDATHVAPQTRPEEYKRARVVARLRLWESMVSRTMEYMNDLKAEISLFLARNNGTLFLNMAYEEVGLPTLFVGMKKYSMCKHFDTINFYPPAEDFLIRGLDYTKQGQTPIAIKLNKQMMCDIMSPDNEITPLAIVEDVVQNYPYNDIPSEDLVLKAKYKPEKKNIPVLQFIERMRHLQERYAEDPALAAVYKIPDAGDKFAYIIARKETKWNMRGCKIELKKGDRMEFYRAYLALRETGGITIDIDWYVKNAFLGVYARYIAYEEAFQPRDMSYDPTNRDDYAKIDELSVKAAVTYLENTYDARVGFDKGLIKSRGTANRSVYRRAVKAAREHATASCGAAAKLYYDIATAELDTSLGKKLCEMATIAALEPESLGRDGAGAARFIMNVHGIWHVWTYFANLRGRTPMRYRTEYVAAQITSLEREICATAPRITAAARATNDALAAHIDAARMSDKTVVDSLSIEQINSTIDKVALEKVHTAYTRLVFMLREKRYLYEFVSEVMLARAGNEARAPDILSRPSGHRKLALEDSRRAKSVVIPAYDWC